MQFERRLQFLKHFTLLGLSGEPVGERYVVLVERRQALGGHGIREFVFILR